MEAAHLLGREGGRARWLLAIQPEWRGVTPTQEPDTESQEAWAFLVSNSQSQVSNLQYSSRLRWLAWVRGSAHAADAPNPPGTGSAWTTGAKQGIGTSTTAQSKVWFTIGQGITDEVYYPRVDLPNVQDFQFVVTDHATFVDVERDATKHEVVLPNPQALTYRQINTAKSGRYRLTKTYVTDVDRPTLLIETRFEVLSGGPFDLFVLYNPSLNGSGMGDTAVTEGDVLGVI